MLRKSGARHRVALHRAIRGQAPNCAPGSDPARKFGARHCNSVPGTELRSGG